MTVTDTRHILVIVVWWMRVSLSGSHSSDFTGYVSLMISMSDNVLESLLMDTSIWDSMVDLLSLR